MFKLKNFFKETQSILKDDKKKEEFITKQFSTKNMIKYFAIFNFLPLLYLTYKNSDDLNMSLTRFLSRVAGNVGNLTIPTSLRKFLFETYIKQYKVNKDEMLEMDLSKYKSFKEFFTREINMEKRPVEDKSTKILSSPCDGTILSCSEVKNLQDLIIVKDIPYSLSDFLFGTALNYYPELGNFLVGAQRKYHQITIYLSPGDCHRYYSPNDFNIEERIYIPGYLEPVKPKYLNKHSKVLLTNERVTLKCSVDGSDKPSFVTFVGALNVGSVNLSFDDFLETNKKITREQLANPSSFVLKYANVLGAGTNKIERKELNYYKPKMPLFFQYIDQETDEFDIRDMIDVDFDVVAKYKVDLRDVKVPFITFKEKLIYESLLKGKESLAFNMSNNFMSYNFDLYKIKHKLKNQKKLNIEGYNLTNKGVALKKKDEVGWFNFGSTIVLIFPAEENKEIEYNFKPGEKVQIGQSLFKYI